MEVRGVVEGRGYPIGEEEREMRFGCDVKKGSKIWWKKDPLQLRNLHVSSMFDFESTTLSFSLVLLSTTPSRNIL